MKTLKIAACLLFLGIAGKMVAQQSSSATKPATSTKGKKQTKPATKGMDNKIAVSDQAQTSEKSNKKQPAKSANGVSNK